MSEEYMDSFFSLKHINLIVSFIKLYQKIRFADFAESAWIRKVFSVATSSFNLSGETTTPCSFFLRYRYNNAVEPFIDLNKNVIDEESSFLDAELPNSRDSVFWILVNKYQFGVFHRIY